MGSSNIREKSTETFKRKLKSKPAVGELDSQVTTTGLEICQVRKIQIQSAHYQKIRNTIFVEKIVDCSFLELWRGSIGAAEKELVLELRCCEETSQLRVARNF